jgi:hypothetical protein
MPYLLAILALVLAPSAAYANALTGTADIPVGEMVQFAAPYIGYGLFCLSLWMVRHLPTSAAAYLQAMHVDNLIADAIRYGINAVEGVTLGREIPLPLANPVAVLAVEYALNHAQPWIVGAIGTPERLAQRIWANLNLPASASLPDFSDIAARAQA